MFRRTVNINSEGEVIALNLGTTAYKIGNFLRNHEGADEVYILMDAIDSGLSIDAIEDVKKGLFYGVKVSCEHYQIKNYFIVVAANSYALARLENCYDVYNGIYISFKDYDDYRAFILKTKEEKTRRDNINSGENRPSEHNLRRNER